MSLRGYLDLIERYFDVTELLQHTRGVQDYYTVSNLAYQLVYSGEGAVHMGLGSAFDYLQQARYVATCIEGSNAQAILELGCGRGFNLQHLATSFPSATFTGIDVTPIHVQQASSATESLANVVIQHEDFHQLSFSDSVFDIVFAVESLCHAHDPARALLEIHRTLRPAGRLVIFDGYRGHLYDYFDADWQHAVQLVEAAMSLHAFQQIDTWLHLAHECGFKLVHTEDLSAQVLPSMRRMQRRAHQYFAFPEVWDWTPLRVRQNAIAGLLMPMTVQAEAHRYYLIELEA